jgi:hypothetical protein
MTAGPAPLGVPSFDALGPAYVAGLDRDTRHALGAFYTPAVIADGLVARAIEGRWLGPPERRTVCDPCVGGGAFLLAAARQLARHGHERATVLADLVWGADIDPDAVAVTRAALEAWAAEGGTPAQARHVVVGDSLAGGRRVWPDAPDTGFDLVVGNPPFQSQLGRDTARSPTELAALRLRLGSVVTPYVDTAGLFLVEATRSVAAGGRVVLILPESFLAARDGGPARAAALADCELVGMWWGADGAFDAMVDVCAPIIERSGARSGSIPRWRGVDFGPASAVVVDRTELAAGRSWSRLLAESGAPPLPSFEPGAVLGSIAAATAGFRDQFYGVSPYVDELGDGGVVGSSRALLVTSGLVDPFRCRWGIAPTRFASRRWEAPVVDLDALRRADPALSRWAAERMVPKVVLATQTRVLEPAVDVEGSWWPSVPIIAVTAESADAEALWRIAAVLAAPPISAWALDRYRGSALSADAIKLSARQVLEIPLPLVPDCWDEGASWARVAHEAAAAADADAWGRALDRLGRAMTRAYRADPSVLDWWSARRPPWRAAPSAPSAPSVPSAPAGPGGTVSA